MKLAFCLAIALVPLGGCDVGINHDLFGGGPAEVVPGDMAVVVVQTGLPCDVARILSTNCLVCHGPKPLPGVPMSLVTYEDLETSAVKGGSYAARSAARMREPKLTRMPPDP